MQIGDVKMLVLDPSGNIIIPVGWLDEQIRPVPETVIKERETTDF